VSARGEARCSYSAAILQGVRKWFLKLFYNNEIAVQHNEWNKRMGFGVGLGFK
jgi:hypothetical protein